jgi:SAM-dependent methyltransferase
MENIEKVYRKFQTYSSKLRDGVLPAGSQRRRLAKSVYNTIKTVVTKNILNNYAKVKKIFSKSDPIVEKLRSESIWDNSQEQHCKNNFKVYWELLPEVSNYQLKSITGKENYHYFEYMVDFMKENIGDKNLRGLSIGCQEWDPPPEEILIKRGLFNKMEVLDIAEGLLNKQAKLAVERGITRAEYKIKDCNNLQLEENAYDLIFAFGTVHHIEKLDLLFDQINRGLKSNGLFVMREYIGPNRIQFTEKQLSIVNEILSILPEKYRITFDGFIKKSHTNYDLEMLLRTDPSESVNSQGIMPAIKEHLDIIKLDYTGGTILHPLLNGIASSFEKDEDGAAIIKLLIFFEKTLIEKGVLPSDYVFCMAKKKVN